MTLQMEHGADRVTCEPCGGRGYYVIPCSCGCRGKLDGCDEMQCGECDGKGYVELERED